MTPDNATEVERLLGELPRSDRVRSRCHGVLARGRAPVMGAPRGSIRRAWALESAIVGGFSVIYLSAVALITLRSYRGL